MSAETSPESVPVEIEKQEDIDLQAKVRAQMSLSSAVYEYLESSDKLDAASKAMKESYCFLGEQVKPSSVVVVRITYGNYYGKHFLLTTDYEGEFKLDAVDII